MAAERTATRLVTASSKLDLTTGTKRAESPFMALEILFKAKAESNPSTSRAEEAEEAAKPPSTSSRENTVQD